MIFKFRSGKAKYGTTVPYKRIHINEDGTFTDILTGKGRFIILLQQMEKM